MTESIDLTVDARGDFEIWVNLPKGISDMINKIGVVSSGIIVLTKDDQSTNHAVACLRSNGSIVLSNYGRPNYQFAATCNAGAFRIGAYRIIWPTAK